MARRDGARMARIAPKSASIAEMWVNCPPTSGEHGPRSDEVALMRRSPSRLWPKSIPKRRCHATMEYSGPTWAELGPSWTEIAQNPPVSDCMWPKSTQIWPTPELSQANWPPSRPMLIEVGQKHANFAHCLRSSRTAFRVQVVSMHMSASEIDYNGNFSVNRRYTCATSNEVEHVYNGG